MVEYQRGVNHECTAYVALKWEKHAEIVALSPP
jgi:hypothetical protein